MVRWDDLRILLALHRAGTSRRASEELGIDETTVHRRLAALGDALGAPLVLRARGRFVLTELAEEIVREAVSMERCVERAAGQADRSLREASGRVRITAPQFFAAHVLGPALPTLLDRYQRLAVEIVATDLHFDLTRAETDVAVRIAKPKGDGLVMRRIGGVEFAWYASVAIAADAAPNRALHYQRKHLSEDERGRLLRLPVPSVECNSEAVAREAAAVGAGWALLPTLTGGSDPRLVRKQDGGHRDLWLVVHKDQKADPRIAAVRTWIGEAMALFGASASPLAQAPRAAPKRKSDPRKRSS